MLYRCREYEIRIFVDIHVQFYVKSSGTFDGFLFITLLKVNKKFFLSTHTIHKYTKRKKNN